ncbi:MAG: hypothetical protein ACRENP_14805 [Longimicrobiales bacterium]
MKAMKACWVVTAMLAAGLALPGSATAQFGEGQKTIGFHLGMSGVGSAAALGAQGEFAYNKNIGIGAWFDTWSYDYSFGTFNSSVRYIAIAGTGAYHFAIASAPKFDPFLGVAIGYYIVNYSDDFGTFDVASNRLFVGGFGGARYAFTPRVSGVATLGVGAAYLTVGLDFKL